MKRLLLIVVFALASIGLVYAQDDTSMDMDTDDTTTVEIDSPFSSACDPTQLNWCYAGQPWGDGRCDTGDPSETAYYYLEGFYRAAEACGILGDGNVSTPANTPVTTSGGFSVSCTAAVRGDTEVSLTANWSSRIDTQAQIVWRFVVELADSPDEVNYGETKTLGTFDTSASTFRSFPRDVDLISATAYIYNGFGNSLTDAITCSVSN